MLKKNLPEYFGGWSQGLPLLFHREWARIWGGKPPQVPLLVSTLAIAIIMGIPLIYVFYRAYSGDWSVWSRLWATRMPLLLVNTITLVTAVPVIAVLLAVPLAWVTVRSDLPGRRLWNELLTLPLAIPPYIGALTYIYCLGFDGAAYRFLPFQFPIYSFVGATLVLSLFTFPYVFLLVSASLRSFNANLYEAGLVAGCTSWGIFRRIMLPLLRPAIGAGALLVALYVLADFGVVAMLRYDTFTSAIYTQLIGRYDRSAASVLSVVLIGITMIAVWLEWRTRTQGTHYQTSGTYRTDFTVPLGIWKYPCLLALILVVFLATILPLMLLGYMTIEGLRAGAIGSEFWKYTFQSFFTAGTAATVALVAALPVAFLATRYNGWIGNAIVRLAYSGYALPGIVVALGVIFAFNQVLPGLYGTPVLLVTAYVIRFMPQSLQAQQAAFALVSPSFEEAAASCGYSRLESLWKVTLPMMRPGLMAGWALTFLSSLKELPATLLLRPAGFDTLSVRIWIEGSEGFYTLAAPAALLIVAVSILPLRSLAHKAPGR